MNKRVMILVTALFCFGLVLSSNSNSLAAGPVRLTFANWLPPNNVVSKGFEAWAAELESKTGGKYKIDFQHGGVLAGIPQAYDVVATGVADISEVVTMDLEKPFPLTDIPSLPFYNIPATTYTKAWYNSVYKKGYLDKEFSDVKILFQFCGMGEDFLTVKPVNSVDDLKGIKVIIGGGPTKSRLTKDVGAVGVFGGPPDAYMMLQKGIVDAVFISGLGLKEFHWDEFIHYIIAPLRVTTAVHSVLMNKDAYNRLPEDVKKTIDELNAGGRTSIKLSQAFDDLYQAAIRNFLASGGKLITWNDAELAKLNEIAKPLWKDWINAQESKGIPAKMVVDAFYNGLKQLGVEHPALGYNPAD